MQPSTATDTPPLTFADARFPEAASLATIIEDGAPRYVFFYDESEHFLGFEQMH